MFENNFHIFLYFLYFLFTIIISFYIPGAIALYKVKLNTFSKFILAVIIGIVFWGWQGMIFGYLGLRWLTYIYLVISFAIWLKLYFTRLSWPRINFQKNFTKPNILILIIILAGSLLQTSIIGYNGTINSSGMNFCCGSTSDNLFHLALTNQIIQNFPPQQPGMSDTILQNYHYWSNLISAELIRIFNLPLIQTQFIFIPLLISVLLGLNALIFSYINRLNIKYAFWLIFFLYFGADLIYFIILLNRQGLDFSMSSLEDGISFLENIPRAFSIIILFGGINLFCIWIQKKEWGLGLITTLILGTVIGFKVYTGLFILSGLGVLILYYLFKKQFRTTSPLFLTFLFSAVIYLPVNQNAGGLYYTGLWMFRNFIVQPSLGLERLELERIIFLNDGKWLRVAQYEITFLFLFLIAIFGTKLIGFIQSKKSLSLLPKELNLILLPSLFFSLLGGLFFQQTSGGANTFSFLVNVFIIGSIYSALACFYWIKKMHTVLKFIFVLIICSLTLPRIIYSAIDNLDLINNQKSFLIPKHELQAYEYLNKKGIDRPHMLIDIDRFDMNNDSPYLSIFINGKIFLSGQGILRSHNINFKKREDVVNSIFKYENKNEIKHLLSDNKIDYIITRTGSIFASKEVDFLELFYRNNNITIYKVKSTN